MFVPTLVLALLSVLLFPPEYTHKIDTFLKKGKPKTEYDLTLVGYAGFANSFGMITLGIIDQLKDELKINCRLSGKVSLEDVQKDVRSILLNKDTTAGKVSLLTIPLWNSYNSSTSLIPDSSIKIAYSMIESTQPPQVWVEILNTYFDAVVVPDPFLVDVYRNGGVAIPIFMIPIGMKLDHYLSQSPRQTPSKPFIFGSTVAMDQRKNHPLLIEAFAREFGNSSAVVLKLNGCIHAGRVGERYFSGLHDLAQSFGAKNITITKEILSSANYREFMHSFDCFINISLGEGFSICPREALAMGIPCILSDNSAQSTLCNSGWVLAVPSDVPILADYRRFLGETYVGYQYTSTVDDVRAALRDMYENYDLHKKDALEGRKWVQQYEWQHLRGKFLNLVKPKEVLLGDRNEVTDTYLMTDSPSLYEKYLELL